MISAEILSLEWIAARVGGTSWPRAGLGRTGLEGGAGAKSCRSSGCSEDCEPAAASERF